VAAPRHLLTDSLSCKLVHAVAFVHRNVITFMDILHFAVAFRLAGFLLGTRSRRVWGWGGWRVESLKKPCTLRSLIVARSPAPLIPP